MRVLITVKAAPNPSEKYGETVCVAGLRLDLDAAGWVRLYPVNFRELDSDGKFRKYDVVSLMARPTPGDPRAESWRPPLEHVTTPPEWTCPSCGRQGSLEVGEQLPNDTLPRCRHTFLCRYTWMVPRDLATVTCPRCETSQPAAYVNG
jgi:hypothetical protein